jgi:acetyl-CoA carboxylase carboxyltransferase component
MIELAGVTEENNAQAEARYADEVQDPVNAARKGYIDDIIEPQFVRSHIISALQLVTR